MARRQQLINAASDLLAEHAVEEIALADIAKHAGIPAGSAYHFYPNAHSVFIAVAEEFGDVLGESLSRPFVGAEADSWQLILAACIDRAVKIFENSPAYTQLIISGKAPSDIKLADRGHDEEVGRIILGAIEQHFELTPFPRVYEVFFYTTEIVDLMFMLSVNKHGRITDEMAEEAKRAGVAYLRQYLPEFLPRREPD